MKADSNVENEVNATLQTFRDAYANRNIEALTHCFASDADVLLYGTGADEKRIGVEQIKAQAERDWAQTESASMAFDWISISAAGEVAWAAVDGVFNLQAEGHTLAIPVRLTFILERRDGNWLIVHTHCSMPSESQEEGQSF